MIKIKDFVTSCTLTFKAFDFNVQISQSKTKIWHFVASKDYLDKKYAVYCVLDIKKVKSLIKIALRKLPASTKLILVVIEHNEKDLQNSYDQEYTLLTLDILKQFGEEMLKIRENEINVNQNTNKELMNDDNNNGANDDNKELPPPESLIDEIFTKEKLF